MMARRQAGELRLSDEPVLRRTTVVLMSAGCHETPTFDRPGRQLPRDQQPKQQHV